MVPDGVNQVRLMGRVYDRPIARKAKGQQLIKAVLEVDEPKFEDGQWTKRTSYHTVSLFGTIARVFDKKLDHGVFVYVEGRLHNFPYKDGEGKQHLRTEVMASRIVITPHQEEEKQAEPEERVEPEVEAESQPVQQSPEPPGELSDEDFEHMKKVVPLFPEKDEEVEDEDLLPF
jgi:single stranded DNA-binding protein